MKANEKIILTVFVFAVTAGAIVILYLFQLNETVRASISAVFICVVVAFAMLFYKLLKEGRRAEKIHNKHVYFLQTLIDTLPHPVFYKDDKGRYLGCNAAFEIFLGIRKEQLIGKTVFEIATPELAELYHKADLVLFNDSSSGAQIYQGPLNYADGTTHEVVFYKALFKNEDGSTGGLVGSILDITGQKKIEAAYKEQKEFSESLLQNSAVPTFVIDPNHIVLFWNRACEELTGIKAFNVIGTNGHWQAFYNHKLNCLADYIIDGKSIDSLVATQSTYAVLRKSPLHKDGVEAEGWFRNLNGKDRYLFFHAAPIRSIDGSTIAAIQTLEEITERKEREEELSNIAKVVSLIPGEDFFPELVRLIGTALQVDYTFIAKFDEKRPDILQTIALYANGELGENFEYNLNNTPCVGKSIVSYGSGAFKLFPLDPLLVELGIEGYVGIPLFDSSLNALGVMVALHTKPITDVSKTESLLQIFAARVAAELERKIVETELRKLSHAIEQNPAIVMITDNQGLIEYVNPKFTDVTGYTSDEVIGHKPSILKSGYHPSEYYQELWRVIKSGNVWSGELKNRKKNGELYWELASISPIKNDQGEITNIVAVKEDVSERKKLENELRHSQKMEALGTLAGGVAHDFNNILTAIIGYANIVEMKTSPDHPIYHYLEQILGAAEKASTLTKSLLTYSRKQVFQPHTIDLNEIIRRILKLLARIIGENIELKTDLALNRLIVTADPLQIEQILFNLASNARDAMPGHGQLTISSSEVVLDDEFVRVSGYGKKGAYALLAVSDTGMGMDIAVRERIFEPFFTTKEVGRGTGLGLSIVYGIVNQHEGYIDVLSDKNKGTTFKIYLPLTSIEYTITVEEHIEIEINGTETLLIVEDNSEVRQLIKELLTNSGYVVIEAENGEEGVNLFNENQAEIQLLITDMVMPKKNGIEVYEEIKQINPSLPAIFLSGYAEEIIKRKWIIEKGAHFMAKPFAPREFLELVRNVLNLK